MGNSCSVRPPKGRESNGRHSLPSRRPQTRLSQTGCIDPRVKGPPNGRQSNGLLWRGVLVWGSRRAPWGREWGGSEWFEGGGGGQAPLNSWVYSPSSLTHALPLPKWITSMALKAWTV